MTTETIQVHMKRQPGTEDVPLPEYMSEHASGMDVRAAVTEPVSLAPGQIGLIPTGYEVQVRPRSGLALKNGILVVNSPGTIDADYRGEVKIILGNMGREPFTIRRGDRIAQLVLQRVARVQWDVRADLAETDRNHGGFGHTGV